MEQSKKEIIDVAHIKSRDGNSLRITLPKKVAEKLALSKDDNVVVFTMEDGKICIEKLKQL